MYPRISAIHFNFNWDPFSMVYFIYLLLELNLISIESFAILSACKIQKKGQEHIIYLRSIMLLSYKFLFLHLKQ